MADTKKKRGGTSRTVTRGEILSMLPAARQRAKAVQDSGLWAVAAHYEDASERIAIELANGAALVVPIGFVRGLDEATPGQRAALRITPSGTGILWPELGTDLSVAGVIEQLVGPRGVAQALGRRGGQAKSPTKARASRANGARGGRPRLNAG